VSNENNNSQEDPKMKKMTKAQLLKKVENGQAEVLAWETTDTLATVTFFGKNGKEKTEHVEITATPMTRDAKKVQAAFLPNLLAKLQAAVQATPEKELTISAFQGEARNVSLVRIQQQLRRLLFDLAIDLQVVDYQNANVDGLAATLDALVYGAMNH
jgi:hypothetical protein